MASRRAFIHGGIAVSTLAASSSLVRTALAARADSGGRAPPRPIFTVLFDAGFAEGRAFGAAAARHGAPVRAVGRDIGSVWINAIEPRMKTRPAALAGLTAAAPLFCLEYLARDYGLRVVYRIAHEPLRDGRFAHTLTGPPELAGGTRELAAAGAHWAEHAAALAAECPSILPADPAITLLDLAARRDHTGQALYSWLLAPAFVGAPFAGAAPLVGAASFVGAASGREQKIAAGGRSYPNY